MESIHFQAAQHAYINLSKYSRYRDTVAECLHLLTIDHWPRWYVDMIVQKNYPSFDLFDALCFMKVHTGLETGSILLCEIRVGKTPWKDCGIKANSHELSDLPEPFTGIFWGKKFISDGIIKWNAPIILGQMLSNGGDVKGEISPGSAPLEVGYTFASKTVEHLGTERGVARWPYNSDTIYLMKNVNPDLFNPRVEEPYKNWCQGEFEKTKSIV